MEKRKIVFANEETKDVMVIDATNENGDRNPDIPPLSDKYPFGCVITADTNESAAFFAALAQ